MGGGHFILEFNFLGVLHVASFCGILSVEGTLQNASNNQKDYSLLRLLTDSCAPVCAGTCMIILYSSLPTFGYIGTV